MKLIKKLFMIAIIAVAVVLLSFFAQANSSSVQLNLIFHSFESIQIWLLALLSFLAGILFTIIVVLFDVISTKYNEGKLIKENRKLIEELSKIRNQKLAGLDSLSFNDKKTDGSAAGEIDDRF
ncbi:MAG TPA: lipopolysaccharide assembly protein LapA domain-containing protein [bacterium]|nr:lipopolysaccharide assembly protein LapA domain-containing protein [bacterium]HPS29715.1 lipopolysaccharide assembly protein LapA domain-containing protein [bacterium]